MKQNPFQKTYKIHYDPREEMRKIIEPWHRHLIYGSFAAKVDVINVLKEYGFHCTVEQRVISDITTTIYTHEDMYGTKHHVTFSGMYDYVEELIPYKKSAPTNPNKHKNNRIMSPKRR